MRGRLPKIRRKGDAQAAPPDATAETRVVAPPTPDEQATAVLGPPPTGPEAWVPAAGAAAAVPPPTEQHAVPPADLDPAQLQVASSPSFRDRGRLRRRLGYLRRVRELGFRDLGGLVFDLHRFGREGDALVRAKLDALTIVDKELRALERVLRDKPLYVDLREPGIAACPRCAALHGSDARFCPSCGIRLSGPLGIGEIGGAAPPVAPPPGMVVGDGAPAVSAAAAGSTPVSAAAAEAPTVVAPHPTAGPDEPTQIIPPEQQPQPVTPEAPQQPVAEEAAAADAGGAEAAAEEPAASQDPADEPGGAAAGDADDDGSAHPS